MHKIIGYHIATVSLMNELVASEKGLSCLIGVLGTRQEPLNHTVGAKIPAS